MRDTSSLRPHPPRRARPRRMAEPGPHGPARPGYGKMPGIRGLAPIDVIEEGWAMPVDRLAGSGTAGSDTEPARRSRSQRGRTGRRPGTDAGALGLAQPGQAGEASAAATVHAPETA